MLALAPAGEAWPQQYPVLRDRLDMHLQAALEDQLSELGLDGAVERKDLAVALVDASDVTNPRVATVNGDEMMYAASLPKIAILLAVFEKAAETGQPIDPATESELVDMIRKSSNRAATDMIDRVGGDYIARVLRSPRYRLYDPAFDGGLWVGKRYAKGPAFKRDPLHSISHGATAMQVARFYYLLATGRLVSPQASQRMKSILGRPEIHHKFVGGLERKYPDARIYRKSGTWKEWHADSAMVERDGKRYIAVALAHSPSGEQWLRSLILGLDAAVFSTSQPPLTGAIASADCAVGPTNKAPSVLQTAPAARRVIGSH